MRSKGASILRRATVAAFAAAVAVSFSVGIHAEEGSRYRPTDGAKSLLLLPAALVSKTATTFDAGNADSVARRAEEYTDLARRSGDARYFGRSQALVAPWLDKPDASPRLLVAAADLAQQRHEFERSRQLVDRALAVEPRHAGARLMRANLGLLAGDFAAARTDCLAVIQANALAGTICLASALTGPGSLERAQGLLAALDRGEPEASVFSRWRLLTQADLALRAGDTDAAVHFLGRAHALDPAHEETRVRLAAALLESGDAAGALARVDGPHVSAALLVARIRAASQMDVAVAVAARRDFDALLALGLRRGSGSHLREEGEVALYVDGNAVRALELARQNFAAQKDTPDLRLLVGAAIAAHDRATLAYVRDWLASSGFDDRVTLKRLREAEA